MDRENVIKGLGIVSRMLNEMGRRNEMDIVDDALALLKEQQEQIDRLLEESASNAEMAEGLKELLKEQDKEIKALRLLVEWAEECDFGFDQFPNEYERYKDEIKDMRYTDGMIHVAKRTLEDHGAFEEGR